MKKKFKTTVIAIAFLLCGVILGGCVSSAQAEQTYPLKIWKHNENGKMETFCVVDDNTGVNYIVVTGELYEKSVGTAITPRLNADGSLYVSD